jgi:hypothetical protein
VSHPIPLHPADSLERVLEDMRQCVASRRDEGWATRAVMVLIRYELLRVLDILIGLLADFRAGKLPPVLPADCETRAQRTAAPPPASAAAVDSRPQGAAARHIRAPGNRPANSTSDASGDAPEHIAAQHGPLTPHHPGSPASPSRPLRHRLGRGPRGIAGYPSAVPRPPAASAGWLDAKPTHAHFVAYS